MKAMTRVWPVCPRPQPDESVPSWFERIGYEYAMTPALLLSAVERDALGAQRPSKAAPATRLLHPLVADQLAILAQLSDGQRVELWPPQSGWELNDLAFCTCCPSCGMSDLASDRSPYGRQVWQQSWYTVCQPHGTALVLRGLAHLPNTRSCWTHAALKTHREFLAANRYRDLKVPLQPQVRVAILGCLTEIERAAAAAIAGIAPNLLSWGKLTPTEFLLILRDLTTWALTHFESVRSWSVAEDMTATEEQEGYGLIGRGQRLSTSDYPEDRMTRTLRDITNPKVRGAALWTAHALMATCHVAASDRSSGKTTQDRQAALLCGLPAASRQWLARCQANWPSQYCRTTWIDLREEL